MRARGSTATKPCRHTDGPAHDCAYVTWREMLVPIAEAEADERYPKRENLTMEQGWARSRKWDACFHRAMERLIHDPFMTARLDAVRAAVRS